MTDNLLEMIQESRTPLTLGQLRDMTGASREAVQEALDALASEGRVASTRKGGWAVPEVIGLCAAKVSFQRNGTPLAHPLSGADAMPIIDKGPLRCMPGDLVLVRPVEGKCQLNAILKRARDSFAAYIRVERRPRRDKRGHTPEEPARASAVPCDVRIPYDVSLIGNLRDLRNDDIALLRIERYPEEGRPILASVVRILGDGGSLGALMKAVAEDQGFATQRDAAVDAEAEALSEGICQADLEGREDLRDLLLFTIDGSTAKDFDDAVSIRQTDRGLELGVHIADVSHYVTPETALDADALARGTSLYLPGLTVAMLPERLSNNLCSLMPDVDRLAMSLLMQVESGAVRDFRLVPSVIHSKARLTYQEVNRYFEGGGTDIPEAIRDALSQMLALSRALRARRQARGAIDFEIDEPEFILDEQGEPEEILMQPRGEAERLIEDFMLLANETVAALARDTELPFVYRVHEDPDPDKLLALEGMLSGLGLFTRIGSAPHPGVLQGVLEKVKEHPAGDAIRHRLLRALKKARYCEKPLGHYALAMKDYCHFTSPIRRYPDLTVHRMLKLLVTGQLTEAHRWAGRMSAIAGDCSLRESAAVSAERQADGIMAAAWMSHHIGESFDGVVSSVTSWGLYVALPNGVEGLVRVSELDDYYEYDGERNRLVGSATGAVFALGDRVRVRAERANVPLGEIDFQLLPPRE